MVTAHKTSLLASLVALLMGSSSLVIMGCGAGEEFQTSAPLADASLTDSNAESAAPEAAPSEGGGSEAGEASSPDAGETETSVPDAEPDAADSAVVDANSDSAVVDANSDSAIGDAASDSAIGDAAVDVLSPEKCGDNIDNDGDGFTDEDGAIGCIKVYLDGDGDHFGDPKRERCSCSGPRNNETTNNTDCYDSNLEAYPGQTKWFSVDRGDGSFDYDCDGTEEKETLKKGSCSFNPGCTLEEGWAQYVPKCGETGSWIKSCKTKPSTAQCVPDNVVSLTQRCR